MGRYLYRKKLTTKNYRLHGFSSSTVSARKFGDWRVKQESDVHSSCPTRSDTLTKSKTLYHAAGSVTNSVYLIRCRTCDHEYIGETQRALSVRTKEHQDATRLGHSHKSAVAEHVHESEPPHEIDWSSVKVSTKQREVWTEKIREAFSIQ